MNAAQVLEQARALGIELSVNAGTLRFKAPPGRLTPELRQALTVNKAAVIELLEKRELPPTSPRVDAPLAPRTAPVDRLADYRGRAEIYEPPL